MCPNDTGEVTTCKHFAQTCSPAKHEFGWSGFHRDQTQHQHCPEFCIIPLGHCIFTINITPCGYSWDVAGFREVLEQLMECGLVISTSLHGLIFAEAFGIPARWVRSSSLPSYAEGTHKFNDHLTSTGRDPNHYASSIEEAVVLGGAPPIRPAVSLDSAELTIRVRLDVALVCNGVHTCGALLDEFS
eukprot:3680485-Pyramimonas_sp.AAC.3